jgi:hypothetical protein
MVWIWSRFGRHEFGDAGEADDVAAGFGHCESGQLFSSLFLIWEVLDRVGIYVYLRIAFSPFVNTFLQLGQMRDTWSLDPRSSAFSSVKWTSTSVLSEYSCGFSSVDPGQMGDSLIGLAVMSVSVLGVREGTQNEGRADLFDSAC